MILYTSTLGDTTFYNITWSSEIVDEGTTRVGGCAVDAWPDGVLHTLYFTLRALYLVFYTLYFILSSSGRRLRRGGEPPDEVLLMLLLSTSTSYLTLLAG